MKNTTVITDDKVLVDASQLRELISYVWDVEEESCEEYVDEGGHEDDHIFSTIKYLKSILDK